MLSLDQIQPTIATLLASASYLSGLTIVEDVGSAANEKTLADALDARGVAISVWPPYRTRMMAQAKSGIVEFEAETSVFFEVNPERNDPTNNPAGQGAPPNPPGGANKSMLLLVKAGIQAVLAYRSSVGNPQDLFTLADADPITLDAFDPGLFRYHVVFNKRCVL